LRYSAATILHELGPDWETIAAVTGHETVAMARKYTEKRRRARLTISRLNLARANSSGTEIANQDDDFANRDSDAH
jgi:hypothetical protein